MNRKRTCSTIIRAALAMATLAGGTAVAQTVWPSSQLTPQTILPGTSIPMFMNQLPVLDVSPDAQAAAGPVPAGLWLNYPKIATVLPGERNGEPYTLRMCEFQSSILPAGTPLPIGQKTTTTVWGYAKGACPAAAQGTYLGPVFVSMRNSPTSIRFVNALPTSPEASGVIAYRDGVDQTLHWADPNGLMCSMGMAQNPADCNKPFRNTGIPAVPHLHGGEVPPELDGGPDAWFLSSGTKHGPGYYTFTPSNGSDVVPAAANEAIYNYPNTQEAGPYWFHDHTLGATRLNVYAGLAGGYYIVDADQAVPAEFKDASKVVPLILQDRMFDTNGELFFTSGSKGGLLWALNPEHPYWNPEFVGDTIVVNGKAWPFLEVEQKRYRFLFLNGSNARTYELFLVNRVTKALGPAMWVIGTDGGYLDSAVKIDPNALAPAATKLVIMPGERYEVVIDFSQLAPGSRLFLKNTAKTPYPGGATPTGGLDKIVEFRVTRAATTPGIAFDPAVNPVIRAGAAAQIPKLVNFATGAANVAVPAAKTRTLTLNEVMGMPVNAIDPITGLATAYPGGPLEILVNNAKWSGESARSALNADLTPRQPQAFHGDYFGASELPNEGETELWEIVNLTADSHPIHLHLVQFQLVNRQAFDAKKYNAAYNLLFPAVSDPMNPAMPLMVGMNSCTGGVFCPGYGPPLHYFNGTTVAGLAGPGGGKLGGNPDVTPYLKGGLQLPKTQEWGWKDTIQAPPGTVTRLLVRWAPTEKAIGASSLAFPFDPGGGATYGYVWHCHIIDHEDNEMMRPDYVQAQNVTRTYVKGTDY